MAFQAAAAVSRVGVVVLRGVVPQEQARQWKRDLEGYIARNREGIIGFPEDNPVVYVGCCSVLRDKRCNFLDVGSQVRTVLVQAASRRKATPGNGRSHKRSERPLAW